MKLKDLRIPFSRLSERQQLSLLEDVRANRHQLIKERSPRKSAKPRTRKPRNMTELMEWMQSQLNEQG